MNRLKSATRPQVSRMGIAIAAALGLLSGSTVMAQQSTTATPAAPAGEEAPADGKVVELDAVMVTANKRVENIREVPSSISVIGQEELESLHVTQLSDLQARVPGLFVTGAGSPGKTGVSLRGVQALSSGATVGTYIDETPLGSSGIYQAANFFALDLLPYDIGRVEVLRGPQGTLYGAGSMGGLVKYVTVAPDLGNQEIRVGGGISSVQDSGDLGWNARFGANIPLVTDSVGLRVSYAHNDLPGYIDNSFDGREDINGGEQTSARAALLWQGEEASLTLVAMRQTIDSQNNAQVGLDPETGDPIDGDLTNSVIVDEPFFKDVDNFSATLNWDLGWADFVSATGYSDTDSVQRQDASLIYGEFTQVLGLADAGSSYFDIGLDLTKFTQEFRLVSKANGPFEWMIGGFYTKEEANQTQTLTLSEIDGSPLPAPLDSMFGTLAILEIPSEYKETAIFANGSYDFGNGFKLGAGVRYAENDQTFSQNVLVGANLGLVEGESPGSSSEGVFTWSLSPQYQISEDTMVYGRVATGYQPGGPNVVATGLPSQVDSSTLTNYEIGLRTQSADRRLVFDLTGFYIDWSDIQVSTVVNGLSGLVNAGKASSQGVELATSFQVSDSFRLGLNAAYTDSKLDEDFPIISIPVPSQGALIQITNGFAGDQLPYVADWSWAATGDYDIVLDGGWSAHFGGAVRYVGDRTNTTTNLEEIFLTATTPPTLAVSTLTEPLELASYWALDLNASLSNENWTLRAYAKNVTDERGYQSLGDVVSEVTGATGKLIAAPIQPRTFGFEVDYTF